MSKKSNITVLDFQKPYDIQSYLDDIARFNGVPDDQVPMNQIMHDWFNGKEVFLRKQEIFWYI
ncbi:MAG: hypothetical protein ACP5OG_03040 [Candidatus Nanoarchaeia archaeon]